MIREIRSGKSLRRQYLCAGATCLIGAVLIAAAFTPRVVRSQDAAAADKVRKAVAASEEQYRSVAGRARVRRELAGRPETEALVDFLFLADKGMRLHLDYVKPPEWDAECKSQTIVSDGVDVFVETVSDRFKRAGSEVRINHARGGLARATNGFLAYRIPLLVPTVLAGSDFDRYEITCEAKDGGDITGQFTHGGNYAVEFLSSAKAANNVVFLRATHTPRPKEEYVTTYQTEWKVVDAIPSLASWIFENQRQGQFYERLTIEFLRTDFKPVAPADGFDQKALHARAGARVIDERRPGGP